MSGMAKAPDQLKKKTIALPPLLEILECPICLEEVKVPFKQCEQGHLVCSVCAETLTNCPNCRGTFSLENPICVKKLIEALPRLCKHNGNGCAEIVEPKDDHELLCGYRPIKCERCGEEKQVLQLKLHLEKDHIDNPTHKHRLQLKLQDFNKESTGIFNISIFAMNTLLWLKLKQYRSGQLDIGFEGVFVGKQINDYFITLDFEKDNIGLRITLKASGDAHKHGEKEISFTKIFQGMVERCINNEGDLMFSYDLISRPKSA